MVAVLAPEQPDRRTTPDSGPVHPLSLLVGEVGYTWRDLWRGRIAFVFTFAFPLIWLVLLAALIGNDPVEGGGGVRILQFLTPTAAVMGAMFGTYPTIAGAMADARESGTLKRVRGTPMPPWVYLAGRIGAAVVMALGSLALMLLTGVLAYDVEIVGRTALASLVTTLLALGCFAALGLAVAAVARSAQLAQAVSIGSAVAIAFLSGVMAFGDMPTWADRVAALFPLKPYNDAMNEQFDPFGSGSGWDLEALAVIVAWGAVGAAVAAARFRWDPAASPRREPRRRTQPHPASTVTGPTVSGRPRALRLVAGEVRWTLTAALRDPGWMFFALVMPPALYAFTESVMSGGEVEAAGGSLYHLRVAVGMIGWGVLMTGLVNMPAAVAMARDRGVLLRARGTPLRPSLLLLGRMAAAVVLTVSAAALVLLLGAALLDLEASWSGLPLALLVLTIGTLAITACGFLLASALHAAKAVTAVGLAIALPLAFFSDVFAVDQTPGWMQDLGWLLPLKHLTHGVTSALDPGGPSGAWISMLVLLAWVLAAGAVGLRRFRWTPRSG